MVRRGSPDLADRSKVLGSARPSNGESPLGPALLRPCHQSRAMPGVAWHGKCSRFLLHDTKLHFCHCQWASDCVLCIVRFVPCAARSPCSPPSFLISSLSRLSFSPPCPTRETERRATHVGLILCGLNQQSTLAPQANQPCGQLPARPACPCLPIPLSLQLQVADTSKFRCPLGSGGRAG